ncbi:MAG: 2-hydroxyacyl-CoA dehydratase [Dehalococcoidales bacterium]|nr:2-hydroxyacyl-CoA dehydratase [Dehalococcoidales bacterium]
MTALEVMQKHYRQRDLAAREWKKKGKVIGYFCDIVPEELISASGFFPYRLSGNPSARTDIARQHLVPRHLKREDFVHSMLNMLLTGEYDYLDYLVIPHTRDSIHRLYQTLIMLKDSNPDIRIPEFYFIDTVHSNLFISERYLQNQFIEFKNKLEEWSGKKITDKSLSEAISVTNENRILLKKVAELRASEPPRISGVDALQIIGSSMFMLKEDHNNLLRHYLSEEKELPCLDGIRLFVSGSPTDNLQLYEVIESNGAVVVGEDTCWGNRYSDGLIDTSLNPLEAITDRYYSKSPCPRMYPLKWLTDYSVKSAEETGSQAVLCYVFENAVAEAWSTPDKIREFQHQGVPVLALTDQKYLIAEPEVLGETVKNFLDTAIDAGGRE